MNLVLYFYLAFAVLAGAVTAAIVVDWIAFGLMHWRCKCTRWFKRGEVCKFCMTETRKVHYCEIHVTVRGVALDHPALTNVGGIGWWSSAVSKSDFDDPQAESIFTTRAATTPAALELIKSFVKAVADVGGTVIRSKVEEVTFDTKCGDELLNGATSG